MSTHRPWPPVYPEIASGQTIRVQADIPVADHRAVLGVAANTGIISHIIQQTFKFTADYVRSNHLTFTDSEEFVRYICERSFSCPAQTSVSSKVARRATLLRERAAHQKMLSTESGEDATTGR